MGIEIEPFRVGQSVRILPSFHRRQTAVEIYTVVRCNEADSRNPSYVLECDANHSRRRESHDRLVLIPPDETLAHSPFTEKGAQ